MKRSRNVAVSFIVIRAARAVTLVAVWLGVLFLLGACPSAPPKTPTSRGAANGALVWSFEYDQNGRLINTVDPGDQSTTVSYVNHANGRIQRITRQTVDGARAIQDFDESGRSIRNELEQTETSFSYDPQGRLAGVHREGLPQLTFSYDTLDRQKSLRIGSRDIVSKYDILGRLSALSTPWGTIKYDYSVADNLVMRTLPTGTRTAWKLDIYGQPLAIEHSDSRGRVIARFTYTRRSDGRVRSVREEWPGGDRTISYEYDTLGQLMAVNESSSGKTSFRYDGLANRTAIIGPDGKEVTAVHDFAGRLARVGTSQCEHDAAGNLVGCAPNTYRYLHATTGSLSKVINSAATVEYRYDATGLLIGRKADGHELKFLADPTANGWRPLYSKHSDGTETVYLWDGELPVAVVTDGQPRFLLHDNLGSVRVLVDSKGNVVARQDYEAFGEPRTSQRSAITAGFAGLFYDAEAKLYLTRSRAYDPQLGRFLERDPELRIPGISAEDLSAYSYCGNDPINSVDLSGAKKSEPTLYEQYQKISYMRIPKRDFTQYGFTVDPKEKNAGRHGTQNTRLHNHLIALELQRKGWTITHMGGGWTNEAGKVTGELRLPPMPGVKGAEGANYLDIVAVKGDRLLFVNTYTTDSKGNTTEGAQDASIMSKIARYQSSNSSPPRPNSPSNVGGVALAGMGAALNGVGQLQGVALDDNGRIILIASDSSVARLPAMHLDDVVTVFRSVYEHSESPLVSIDPNPENPKGPTLLIRHGTATSGTYVGWVLFEADRVMKTYSLGKDNITGNIVRSRIPGYKSIVDGAMHGLTPGKEVWERFWIVPSQRVETSAPDSGNLTLLDVSLQVNTQVMVLKGGQLTPAANEHPSPDASSFAAWFTRNYSSLENEVIAKLPSGHGRPFGQVSVFAELRRVALLTAVAEKARDDGVPLPSWIRSHKVTPFPMPTTTPRLAIEKRLDGKILSVAGGVSLVTPPAAVVRKALPDVQKMIREVATALPATAAVSPRTVSLAHGAARVVALPGADTQDVGAVVSEERDIQVPLNNGRTLALTRRWNSFFDVSGELGQGWTLDLPVVKERWQKIVEAKKKKLAFEMTSPHGTLSAWFNKLGTVPELGSSQFLVPGRTSDAVALAPLVGGGSSIWLRGGRELSFDKHGRLTQERQGETIHRYRRDNGGRLIAIEATGMGSNIATIRLEYDSQGRIVSSIGSNGEKVDYRYEGAFLSEVIRARGNLRYAYASNRLVDIWEDSQPRMHIEYDAAGRVVKQKEGAHERTYTYKIGSDGVTVTTAGGPGERSTFDASMRPVEERLADGSILKWSYSKGKLRGTATLPNGDSWNVERRDDGRQEIWTAPRGAKWRVERDALSRVSTIRSRDEVAAQFAWLPSGHLQSVSYETSAITPSYSANGTMTGYMMHPAGAALVSDWVKVKWDDRTRTTEVTDSTGLRAKSRKDANGRLASIQWGKERLDVVRDSEGRVTSLQALSGLSEQYSYVSSGSDTLARSIRREAGQESVIEYQDGLPTLLRSFDGSETRVTYSRVAGGVLVAKRVALPNGTVVEYQYDEKGRLRDVVCGNTYRLRFSFDNRERPSEIVIEPVK